MIVAGRIATRQSLCVTAPAALAAARTLPLSVSLPMTTSSAVTATPTMASIPIRHNHTASSTSLSSLPSLSQPLLTTSSSLSSLRVSSIATPRRCSLVITPRRTLADGQDTKIDVAALSTGAQSKRTKSPLFNTYTLVQQLRDCGLSDKQSVAVMDALIASTEQAQEVNAQTLATKTEFSALGSAMSEKLFNSSLKFDMQQKHLKEIFNADLQAIKADMLAQQRAASSDFAAFKSDIRMNQKVELATLQQHMVRLEKEVENNKQWYKTEQEHLENKLMKYGAYSLCSFLGLTFAAIRMFK